MKYICLLSLVLVFSCHKQDSVPMFQKQICEQETKAEFTIHNYSEFSKFENSFTDGDANYYSHYQFYSMVVKPAYLSWAVQVNLINICNSDVPKIDFSVLFHDPDPSLNPEGFIRDAPNFSSTVKIVSLDGTYFHKNIDYNFKGDFGVFAGFLNATIYFPFLNKGSFSADSAYFFSNLEYMSIKITAHKPQ